MKTLRCFEFLGIIEICLVNIENSNRKKFKIRSLYFANSHNTITIYSMNTFLYQQYVYLPMDYKFLILKKCTKRVTVCIRLSYSIYCFHRREKPYFYSQIEIKINEEKRTKTDELRDFRVEGRRLSRELLRPDKR